jgi:predicted helicase
MTRSTKHWEQFERLVAAIHRKVDPAARVQWSDSINGRQFDVTIRFRKGLYDYLTVIECKEYSSPIPVEKVEAFITKSQDVSAHQAVMASSSGFQSGAESVAKRHNVALIQLTDSAEIDLSMFGATWGPDIEALHIQAVTLRYRDGDQCSLPEAANAMMYYVSRLSVRTLHVVRD